MNTAREDVARTPNVHCKNSLSLIEDDKLPAVELAIDTATRRSLGKGISPFMLSHGLEMRLPFNLDLPVQFLVLDADGNLTADDSRTHPASSSTASQPHECAYCRHTRCSAHVAQSDEVTG